MSDKREISCFFCREFIALYVDGELDPRRRKEIDQHLENCQECGDIFRRTEVAKKVLGELKPIQPSKELIKFLQKEKSTWTDFLERFGWSKWPINLRWGVQLGSVALMLALFVNFFPWLKLAEKVQNFRNAPYQVKEVSKVPAPPVDVAAVDEEMEKQTPEEPVKIDEAKTAFVATTPTPTTTSTPTVVAAATPKPVAPTPTPAPKPQGYVWRGTINVDVLSDELTKRVTQGVKKLGGIKAGKVHLGWVQGNSRYYHFTIPEKNFDALTKLFEGEGKFKVQKMAHPRVITGGRMRLIVHLKGKTVAAPTPVPPTTPAPSGAPDDASVPGGNEQEAKDGSKNQGP